VDRAAPLSGLTLEAAERLLNEHALRDTRGNVSEAARRLGVSRMTCGIAWENTASDSKTLVEFDHR
jgi:ActR/RegA family two-component response regulator